MNAANRPLSQSPAPATRRVLMVCEDKDSDCPMVGRLRSDGHSVSRASTAAEALALAREAPPDIVFCDLTLPSMTGHRFLGRMRAAQPAGHVCYIVAVLPNGAEALGIAALEAGADDLLFRPVSPAELSARLAVGLRMAAMTDTLRAGTARVEATLARLKAAEAAMEADLAEARQLQQGLVGERRARFGPFDVSLLFRPSGHIGGDLVGFFPINASRVALYAIDVSGSGVAAALLTARLAAHLSGSVGQNLALLMDDFDLYDALPPVEVARRFNLMMCDEFQTDAYFTMIYIDFDTQSGEARLVQAGHPHPLLQRADGRIETVGDGGMPIGLIRNARYEEVRVRLDPGDRLFLASDGITEAANPQGRLLEHHGLEAIMRTNAMLRGASFLESLCWMIAQYTSGTRTDDISAVLIERDGEM